MLNTHTDNLLQVYDTYIELPSGRQISLDCQNAFTPNSEFWDLWNQRKLELKRAGVFITKEEDQWRGYVRSADEGFSYSQSDLHAYWIEKAKEIAAADECDPVLVKAKELSPTITTYPCKKHDTYNVIAKMCRNNTFQIRLHCDYCKSKTPGAIAWGQLGSEIVIRVIAIAIQQKDILTNMNFV